MINEKKIIFMYGNYIRILADSLNDVFLLSLVKHAFMIIVNQGLD